MYVSSGHNAGYQLANVRKTLQLTKTFGIKLHTFLLFEQLYHNNAIFYYHFL